MTITICVGSSCHLKGSYKVISNLKKHLKDYELEDKVTLKAGFCMGNCIRAVSVKINDERCHSINPETVDKFFKENILRELK